MGDKGMGGQTPNFGPLNDELANRCEQQAPGGGQQANNGPSIFSGEPVAALPFGPEGPSVMLREHERAAMTAQINELMDTVEAQADRIRSLVSKEARLYRMVEGRDDRIDDQTATIDHQTATIDYLRHERRDADERIRVLREQNDDIRNLWTTEQRRYDELRQQTTQLELEAQAGHENLQHVMEGHSKLQDQMGVAQWALQSVLAYLGEPEALEVLNGEIANAKRFQATGHSGIGNRFAQAAHVIAGVMDQLYPEARALHLVEDEPETADGEAVPEGALMVADARGYDSDGELAVELRIVAMTEEGVETAEQIVRDIFRETTVATTHETARD